MIYSFDIYHLDTELRTLRRSDALVELTPKVFQTLVVLIENHDHVMSKDELLGSIWPDHTVEEANITQNISVLRKALEERARGRKYIATFPGVGYRFLEPVAVRNGDVSALVSAPALPEPLPGSHPLATAISAGAQRWHWWLALIIVVGGTAGGARWMRVLHATATVVHGMEIDNLHTVVRIDGAEFHPALSPDGRRFAFVFGGMKPETSGIYLQVDGDLQDHAIVTGTGEYSSPAFSPDGSEIAFLHLEPSSAEVEIYNFATRRTREVTKLFPHRYGLSCRHLDWAPNGRYLVVDDKDTENEPLSLYLISLSNGTRTRLSDPSMDIIGDLAPRFSPDGTQIAFIRMKYQYEYDIYILPASGGNERRVTQRSALISDLDWASNSHLVYGAATTGRYALWDVDLSAANGLPTIASSYETDMPVQLSIARNAAKIALVGYRPDLNIWSLDLKSARTRHPVWTPIIRTPGQDIAPIFSRDGSQIAFRSDISGRMQVWISRPDGSGAHRLRSAPSPSYVSWSPDGESVAYSADGKLYTSSTIRDDESYHLIRDGFSHPWFSVDGQWIFARRRNVIYRIPLHPDARHPVPEKLTVDGGAPILQSPDGRYLYFGHGRMDTTVTQLDLATDATTIVLHNLVPGYRDCWTTAPGGIVYLAERAGVPTLLFHDVTTGRDRKIAPFPGPLPPVATSGFSVSPDGSRLLVVRSDLAFSAVQEGHLERPPVRP